MGQYIVDISWVVTSDHVYYRIHTLVQKSYATLDVLVLSVDGNPLLIFSQQFIRHAIGFHVRFVFFLFYIWEIIKSKKVISHVMH